MGSQGSLGGIHGYLGGTDGTLGPMGPWDRWDLGLKDPRYFLRGYFLRVVYRYPAQPGPAGPAGPDQNQVPGSQASHLSQNRNSISAKQNLPFRDCWYCGIAVAAI